MNKEQLWRKAASVSGGIEQRRWELARLADEAAEAGVAGYAEIIGDACRRAPSTIYEWQRAERLRKSARGSYKLSISFWVTAANGLNDENYQERLDWLMQSESDKTITLESARVNFPRKPKPEPPPFNLSDWLSEEYERIDKVLDNLDETTHEHWVVGVIAQAIDRERGNIIKRVKAGSYKNARGVLSTPAHPVAEAGTDA